MDEVVFLKRYLRQNGALYVSSKEREDIININLTFGDDNFNVVIDKVNKLMLLTKEPSLYEETGLFVDELYTEIEYEEDEENEYEEEREEEFNSVEEFLILLNDCIIYTSFKDYPINIINYMSDEIDGTLHKSIKIESYINGKKMLECHSNWKTNEIGYKAEIIENTDGLDNFHSKIFTENWLEDFNLKIKDYSEKDLYLIISTLVSYNYKLLTDNWQDIKIDPYVINNALEVATIESKKYNEDFTLWYSNWNKYFTKEKIKQYINKK